MHYLYFVVVDKEEATTSEEARINAYNTLEREWFVNSWYFWNWPADYYSVWWKWTWLFSELNWKDTPDREWTSNFNMYWYEDDAIIITEDIINKLKENYKDDEDIEIFNSMDYEDLKLSTFNTEEFKWHWLVIIDYHN